MAIRSGPSPTQTTPLQGQQTQGTTGAGDKQTLGQSKGKVEGTSSRGVNQTGQDADVLERSEEALGAVNKTLQTAQKVGSKLDDGALDRVQNKVAKRARTATSKLGKASAKGRVGLANVQAGMDIAQAVKSGSSEDIAAAAKSTASAAIHDVGLVADNFSKRGSLRLGTAATAGWGVMGAINLPDQVQGAYGDVQKAVKSGATEDILNAGESSGSALLTGAQVANNAVQATSRTVTYAATKRAATQALKSSSPELSKAATKAVSRAVADSAAKSVVGGASRKVATSAAKEAAEQALRRAAPGLSRAARRAALRSAGKAGAKAAAKAGTKALAKGAARFAPGLNVAVAAYDTAIAAKDLADPKASWLKKTASVATAAGSIVSATNIPIVSQVGAGVSFLTGLAREFL